MTPTGTTHTQDLVELVPDKLFLLGGDIALDGRISWAPADTRGWQPCNCYVLLEEESCLVVDPGPAHLGETVVEQLKTLIPAGSTLSIFLSHAELDTTGGIGAIARAFPVDRLYAGVAPTPLTPSKRQETCSSPTAANASSSSGCRPDSRCRSAPDGAWK